MTIQTHGLSCIVLTAKPLVGEVSVVLDPFQAGVGLRLPTTLSGDVVVCSRLDDQHGAFDRVGGSPFVVTIPGEYEVKGVTVDARVAPLADDAKHIVVRVVAEGIAVGFLGSMNRALTTAELEILEGVDVLIVPVGGGDVLSPKDAAEVVLQVEPRVVIPVHAAMEGLKVEAAPVEQFLKQMGVKAAQTTNKYKVLAAQLPQDDMEVVVLTKG